MELSETTVMKRALGFSLAGKDSRSVGPPRLLDPRGGETQCDESPDLAYDGSTASKKHQKIHKREV